MEEEKKFEKTREHNIIVPDSDSTWRRFSNIESRSRLGLDMSTTRSANRVGVIVNLKNHKREVAIRREEIIRFNVVMVTRRSSHCVNFLT